jgi:hypothetical protein
LEFAVGLIEAKLQFEPIDLDSAAKTAIAFRADSFVCSFGSAERFYEADGKGHERYLVWLRERMQSIPGSCVHAWKTRRKLGNGKIFAVGALRFRERLIESYPRFMRSCTAPLRSRRKAARAGPAGPAASCGCDGLGAGAFV